MGYLNGEPSLLSANGFEFADGRNRCLLKVRECVLTVTPQPISAPAAIHDRFNNRARGIALGSPEIRLAPGCRATHGDRRMALTPSGRKAVAHALAPQYAGADKAGKSRILDELCATTGWHRSHARKALTIARRPESAGFRRPRAPKYGREVIAALIFCWEVMDRPASKRLAPMLPELVPVLRRFNELRLDDEAAALLTGISAATIDRRLAQQRQDPEVEKRRQATPAFLHHHHVSNCVEPGGISSGHVRVNAVRHSFIDGTNVLTLIVIDTGTGWTEKRSVLDDSLYRVPTVLDCIANVLPFPIRGIEAGTGTASISSNLHAWCRKRGIIFTDNRSDRTEAGTLDWPPAGAVDCPGESRDRKVALLNQTWILQSMLINYFYAQRNVVAVTGVRATASRKHGVATTPYRRALKQSCITDEDKAILSDNYLRINPAAVQRHIMDLTMELQCAAPGENAVRSNAGPQEKAIHKVSCIPHDIPIEG